MKKVLLANGAGLMRFCAAVAALGTWLFLAPSSFAQPHTYTLQFIGLPSGGSIDLTQYIGLDRKLKPNVGGQTLHISVSPPLTKPQSVILTIVLSGSGSAAPECNGEIARAITMPFDISGAGRDLGSSAFTGSGGIGIAESPSNQPCINALADKLSSGIGSVPAGTYTLSATLKDVATSTPLNVNDPNQPAVILVTGASTNEATINLTSPLNGDQVPAIGSVIFSFDNSIGGRLLAFEHSSLTQSQDDATRDLNSPLKMLDVPVTSRGSNQVNARYPGVALRDWTVGRKYSWMFLGSTPGSTDVRRSAVWSFTLVPNDPMLARLAAALMSSPDPVGSTYNNLVVSGYTLAWSGSNPILIQEGDNGIPRTIDISELLSRLADIAHRNIRPEATVTQ